MGRLEKIVVLTVVFLIAVILGVSLNETDVGDPVPDPSGGPSRELAGDTGPRMAGLRGPASPASSPRSERSQPTPSFREVESPERTEPRAEPSAERAPTEERREAPAELLAQNEERGAEGRKRNRAREADSAVEPSRSKRPKLLNASVQLDPAPEDEDADDEPQGPRTILVTKAGLEATHDDQYMLYTWRDGDTFTSVARAYYDSMAHVRLLRLANEGRTERDLSAGDRILVPAVDPDGSLETTRFYTVVEGDTLSSIAQKVYGDPSKYRKIFDANRDVLVDENTLALGQELRIPR